MAILIPSKSIYKISNPKVLDNVISRVEVETVNVTPLNNPNEEVYSETFTNISNNLYSASSNVDKDLKAKTYGVQEGTLGIREYCIAYSRLDNKKSIDIEVLIPIVTNNKYVDNIHTGLNNNGNSNIFYRVIGTKVGGKANANWACSISGNTINVTEGSISYSSPTNEYPSEEVDFPNEIKNSTYTDSLSVTATATLSKWGNINTAEATKTTIDDIEYYKINLTLMANVRQVILVYSETLSTQYDGEINLTQIPLYGAYLEYYPDTVQLSIYGKTIGIDLKNTTTYVPATDKTSKKVFMVEGNELMQESNYYLTRDLLTEGKDFTLTYIGGGVSPTSRAIQFPQYRVDFLNSFTIEEQKTIEYEGQDGVVSIVIEAGVGSFTFEGFLVNILGTTKKSSISNQFNKTKTQYSNGKETVTILCSISDYYDYTDRTKKIISIDNSTNKMIFDEYDQVIPMTYGADGKDVPMSYYKDGSPKVFNVLGVKPYYDGAVWQELYLQEA